MQQTAAFTPVGTTERIWLSTRGFATEAMCPVAAFITADEGSCERLTSERDQWAYCHGLEPLDGEYLRELRRRPLTLSQIGEGLAILGQTRQMVEGAVHRLRALGLVESSEPDTADLQPRTEAIEVELVAALEDLNAVLEEVETDAPLDRRTAGLVLRRAMSRVLAARHYAGVLTAPSEH